MTVAYILNGPNAANYKLGTMILPQLEQGIHGVSVAGIFFFDDNCYVLRTGDPVGERLARVAKEHNILLMMCDQCAIQRNLAEGKPLNATTTDTVNGVHVGCFPDLYKALAPAGVDQVITL